MGNEHSYQRLTDPDLHRIVACVHQVMEEVIFLTPRGRLYRDRLACMVLGQGGAAHYFDPTVGFKDIDVWLFFEQILRTPFPHRTIWHGDFGQSVHGKDEGDIGFVGRRIDIMGRSIDVSDKTSPLDSVRSWLHGGSTSANYVCLNPVIVLEPKHLFGTRLI